MSVPQDLFILITCILVNTQLLGQIMGKQNSVEQGCILSPCVVNLYAEDITRKAGLILDEGGVKISKEH